MSTWPAPLSFKSPKDLRAAAAAEGVALCDLAWTDIRGRLRHVGVVPEGLPDRGPLTLAGLDLTLDLSCVIRDPFAAQGTYKILCHGPGPDARAALAAHGAEAQAGATLRFTLAEPGAATESSVPPFAESPADAYADIRGEVVTVLRAMGVPAAWHHHAGGGPGAGVVGIEPAPLLRAADGAVLGRYALANVAASYGKRVCVHAVTFALPSPAPAAGPALAAVLHPCPTAYRAELPPPSEASGACNPYLVLLALTATRAQEGPPPASLPEALAALTASTLLPQDLTTAYAQAVAQGLGEG
ncbi:MAG TPA: hypothetical protein DDX54_05855 [Rhodospirillaceae bacterium]|jgi:hypothetical protein|nr:hypothetical protein [Alphaproteobacteria bacterium]HBH26908.1 hypothetical protein [Rhodospirillaceae bacterium]